MQKPLAAPIPAANILTETEPEPSFGTSLSFWNALKKNMKSRPKIRIFEGVASALRADLFNSIRLITLSTGFEARENVRKNAP